MSEDLKIIYNRGKELFEMGLYQDAELFLKQVAEKKPAYADVHNKLGVIYELKGLKEKAREHFEKALEINRNYTEAALNLAITLSDMGDSEHALEVLDRICEVNKEMPGELDPFLAGKLANEHYKLGNIYYDLRFLDEAISQYKKAVALRSGLTDIQTKLGVALRDKGLVDEAIEQLKQAMDENPTYCPAMVQLGLSYYVKGEKALAAQQWQMALEIDPSLKRARTFLSLVWKEE